MKLFYSPGACSLSPHIVAREAGIALKLEKVDLQTKMTESGSNYLKITPKGCVPALQLDSGEVLTEGSVITQYLADQKPNSDLAPAAGTMARYRLQEMLAYISTEIHKTFSPLFNPATPPDTRTSAVTKLQARYALIEQALSKQAFLLGSQFTVADAYLFTVTNWAHQLKIDLSQFPKLLAFQKEVAARPAVQSALLEEGLIH